MRPLLWTLLFAATTASAAPLVVQQVPDYRTDDRIDVAPLAPARLRVENAKARVWAAQDRLAADLYRYDRSCEDRKIAGSDLFSARVALWAAHRSNDTTRIDAESTAVDNALDARETAKEHVRWHTKLLKADRADIRTARARVSLAKGDRERVEASLTQKDVRPEARMRRMSRFERQVARLERRVDSRERVAADARDDAQAAQVAWLGTF